MDLGRRAVFLFSVYVPFIWWLGDFMHVTELPCRLWGDHLVPEGPSSDHCFSRMQTGVISLIRKADRMLIDKRKWFNLFSNVKMMLHLLQPKGHQNIFKSLLNGWSSLIRYALWNSPAVRYVRGGNRVLSDVKNYPSLHNMSHLLIYFWKPLISNETLRLIFIWKSGILNYIAEI